MKSTTILLAAATSFVIAGSLVQAQDLRVGVLGGLNYNRVEAGLERLVAMPGDPAFATRDYSGANALTGFAGVSGEYLFNDLIGASLRATYDYRCVEKEVDGATFVPHMTYVTVEPAVRVNLGLPELHASVGGSIGIPVLQEYDYTPASNEGIQEVKSVEMTNVPDVVFGAWGGFGYDVMVAGIGGGSNLIVTPFAEASYLFNQKDPDVAGENIDDWNTLTVRGGVQVKVSF